MNELQIFENPQFGKIRAIEQNGEPWFVAADVCRSLELEDTGRATSRLDEDELTRVKIVSGGQNREVIAVNEAGLYSLVLGSRKPEAKAFKRWITHEVIPSIRKHGAYMTPDTLDKMISSPEFGIKLLTALKEEQEKSRALEAENAVLVVEKQIMQPKADYFDELVDRNLLTNFRETAKQLDIKPKAFVSALLQRKYIYRDKRGKLLPYQPHVESGLFEVKECFNEKTQWSGTQTLVTPKGRETFRLLFIGVA